MTLDNLNTQKIELSYKLWRHFRTTLTAPFGTKFAFDNLNSPCLEHLLFDTNNRLAPYQILSYWELNVVAPISSLAIAYAHADQVTKWENRETCLLPFKTKKKKKKKTEKKRKKSKKAQWYFHLNMTFLGFTDLHTKVISLSLR